MAARTTYELQYLPSQHKLSAINGHEQYNLPQCNFPAFTLSAGLLAPSCMQVLTTPMPKPPGGPAVKFERAEDQGLIL